MLSYDTLSISTTVIVSKTLSDYYGLDINYHHRADGAPYLTGINKLISLSHSGSALVFALSDSPAGIDVEKHVQRDFARLSRKLGFFDADNTVSFYKAWTAYEARYKANRQDLAIEYIPIHSDYTVALAANDKINKLIDISSIF